MCEGLFHEDDQYPDTLDKAFGMLVDIHGRDEWEPGASRLIEPTDANIAVILEEKQAAQEAVRRLPEVLGPETLGLSAAQVLEFTTSRERTPKRGSALPSRTSPGWLMSSPASRKRTAGRLFMPF
ncbi:hypothetical protein SAMN02745194_02015 [Roseomonas rosea]|uniref:Uncharacterized protein n=1 Tax=Muricoccus roseus TaxID=198092 RepID=A0A1M6HIG5_9PROT|nr:hypothetical protein [Roseomonas rosea]SHJ21929.1 hypothetical protein SAMN02745194_02015 [Roseomonas rosea]